MTNEAIHNMMEQLLRVTPHGLAAKTLLNVLTQQDIDTNKAVAVIRRALDQGTLMLNNDMQLQLRY